MGSDGDRQPGLLGICCSLVELRVRSLVDLTLPWQLAIPASLLSLLGRSLCSISLILMLLLFPKFIIIVGKRAIALVARASILRVLALVGFVVLHALVVKRHVCGLRAALWLSLVVLSVCVRLFGLSSHEFLVLHRLRGGGRHPVEVKELRWLLATATTVLAEALCIC